MSEVVRFENVGLRYGLGPEVLQDITFGLEAGSFHFLVGPSGAGKSSLLRLMYLAHRQTRGVTVLSFSYTRPAAGSSSTPAAWPLSAS